MKTNIFIILISYSAVYKHIIMYTKAINISIGNSYKNYCNLNTNSQTYGKHSLLLCQEVSSVEYTTILANWVHWKFIRKHPSPIQVFNLFPCSLLPTYSVHNLKFASFPHHLMPSGFTHMYTSHTSNLHQTTRHLNFLFRKLCRICGAIKQGGTSTIRDQLPSTF